jgi:dipeptidyl-peptidase-4
MKSLSARYLLVASSLLVLIAVSTRGADVPAAKPKANYELASHWTASKVGKLVFDPAVTPHWLEGDRFWYAFENSTGRKFYLVDPAKKTKSLVYDPVKLAAALTTSTGLPYDSQHLPITTIRFVKGEQAIQFEMNVPRDANIPGEKKGISTSTTTDAGNQQNQEDDADGAIDVPQQLGGRGASLYGPPPSRTQKQLVFEYEMGANKLTLLDDRPARKPTWASVSPDDKTIVFARNHDLYMVDAENYAKALKNPNDTPSRRRSSPPMAWKTSDTVAAAPADSRISSSNRSSRTTSRVRRASGRTTLAPANPRDRWYGRAIRRSSR